ncbi:MAG: GlcG/HbpS family heme-binding protein [Alphaproteobacteria bacterium]
MHFASLASAAFAAALVLSLAQPAAAQGGPPPYGAPITFAQAGKVMEGATAEAKKNNWNVVITIVDSGGHMVMLHRLDNTQLGSLEIATGKATTALRLRRPTKAIQDVIAAGGVGLRFLTVPGVLAIDGGLPLLDGGKIVGAIGVSGVTAEQDAQIAKAGVDALGK